MTIALIFFAYEELYQLIPIVCLRLLTIFILSEIFSQNNQIFYFYPYF